MPMHQKPPTPEQAQSKWYREAAEIYRQIDDGKRMHSQAGKMFPALGHHTVGAVPRPQQSGQKSIASTIYPNLPSERKLR
jgi:hypothetical protein